MSLISFLRLYLSVDDGISCYSCILIHCMVDDWDCHLCSFLVLAPQNLCFWEILIWDNESSSHFTRAHAWNNHMSSIVLHWCLVNSLYKVPSSSILSWKLRWSYMHYIWGFIPSSGWIMLYRYPGAFFFQNFAAYKLLKKTGRSINEKSGSTRWIDWLQGISSKSWPKNLAHRGFMELLRDC